ncbi:hypothetical protein COM13_29970 [Bacillus pseudomycoides]|nr:hypothetical protein COO07_28975 [Bacillus pseudomycoides]PEB38556.1 hypothetical protein COO06_27835 [Bacillus pseudomycoides]PEK74107.1 hypothetical protein CN597_26840 [Bacillus pseudomycoides]PEM23942.1 hypothetical protein CN634_30785 [Bacillus pseudomycoides]PEM99327.1 hypothetical protein CN640_30220 [Bacillus pseudomycoides]
MIFSQLKLLIIEDRRLNLIQDKHPISAIIFFVTASAGVNASVVVYNYLGYKSVLLSLSGFSPKLMTFSPFL